MSDIGGFFVKLGLKTDRKSFSEGMQSLQGFGAAAGKITKSIGLTTGGLLAMAKAAGAVETAELKASKALGLSTRTLDSWKAAASMAGVNGNALIGTMQQIENKMQHLKTGTVDMNLAKNLGMIGSDYSTFSKMDAEQRMREVFSRAGGMQDQALASQLVGDILGSAGKEYYDYLKLSGKSLETQLAQGRALTYTTSETKKNAMEFNAEINAVAQAGKSIATLFGSQVAKALTPATVKLKEFLMVNKTSIQTGIIDLTDKLGTAMNSLFGFLSKVGPLLAGTIDRFGGLDKVIIKVGIGIAGLKIAGLVRHIGTLTQSIGLLKLGLSGLAAGLGLGALFMILDDLYSYFSRDGRESLTGYIMDHLDELKAKFNEIVPNELIGNLKDSFKGLKEGFNGVLDSMTKLKEEFRNNQDLRNGLSDIAVMIENSIINSLQTTLTMTKDLMDILAALMKGDMAGAAKATKNLGKDWLEGIVGQRKDYSEFTERERDRLARKYVNNQGPLGNKKFVQEIDSWQTAYPQSYDDLMQRVARIKESKSVHDGIIAPGGHVTQVDPNDWVFAMHDISDLASAFIPNRTTNTMNAPSSYVINQNITVNGTRDLGNTVRQQAYGGTQSAMQQSLSNAQRIMQLMPGTK